MGKDAQFLFDLGDVVEDVVIGAIGTITTRAEHMTGCNTYLITPRKKKGDNSVSEYSSHSCDENRLKLTGEAKVELPKRKPEETPPPSKSKGAMGVPRRTSMYG